jgi:hypothetical protein
MRTRLYSDLQCWRAQTDLSPDLQKESLGGYSSKKYPWGPTHSVQGHHRLRLAVLLQCRDQGNLTQVSGFPVSDAFQIGALAKSVIKAAELGSAGLPAAAKAAQAGKDGARFTVISNAGALAISE